MRTVDALTDLIRPNALRLRAAVVVSFGSGKATITLAGGTVTDVPYLASYSPTATDKVIAIQTDDGQLLILGKPA